MEEDIRENFMGLSDRWIIEIGRLTIAAAFAEEILYQLGEELDLDDIRLDQGIRASRRVRARAHERAAFLASKHGSASDVEEWCRKLEELLQKRHEIVHSRYITPRGPEWKWLRQRSRDRNGPEVELNLGEVEQVRLWLMRLGDRGAVHILRAMGLPVAPEA